MIKRLLRKIAFRIVFVVIATTTGWQVKADIRVLNDTPNTLTLQVTENYVMGDGDTLSDSKKLNIEAVKKASADYAGTYVENMVEVGGSNGESTITNQQVRVLTAGFVEVISRTDTRKVGKQGELTLTTMAKVKLSKKAIKDGLEKLKNDPVKAKKIAELEKNNKMLVDELYKLTKSINNGVSRTDLVKRRSEIMTALNENRTATKGVFTKGTLFQLAIANNSEYEVAKEEIKNEFLGAVINETVIELGEPTFLKRDNGYYDVEIKASWTMPETAKKVLKKHFNVEWNKFLYTIEIEKKENEGDKKKKVFTGKLFDYLASQKLNIEVDFGYGVSGKIPMFKYYDFFGKKSLIFKMFYGVTETSGSWDKSIVISNVKVEDLEKSTSIAARVINSK